jgi:hypothetical protein
MTHREVDNKIFFKQQCVQHSVKQGSSRQDEARLQMKLKFPPKESEINESAKFWTESETK